MISALSSQMVQGKNYVCVHMYEYKERQNKCGKTLMTGRSQGIILLVLSIF